MKTIERLDIWRALSELFLDTEPNDVTFNYIARTILESDFSLAEVEDIFWYEVYPVLVGNLSSVTGEWAGWSDEWLMENLPAPVRPKKIRGNSAIVKALKQDWDTVVQTYHLKTSPK